MKVIVWLAVVGVIFTAAPAAAQVRRGLSRVGSSIRRDWPFPV